MSGQASAVESEGATASPEKIKELKASCTRFLHQHGNRRAADFLAEIPTGTATDYYGMGGVVDEVEGEVARLLGKPCAAFMPSGVMAQLIALRIHTDRRTRRAVWFHPMSHIEQKELRAYSRLHGLEGRPVGEAQRLLTLADLETHPLTGQPVGETPAALLIELPQRDIGGQLPTWEELVAQVDWARGHGAAVHMDGARLWGCEPFYGRSLAEISALFDTVYVSFYKQLGALAGCALAGPADVIAEAKEWRRRHGGTLITLWPNAASGLAGLRKRLPLIPACHRQALAIADVLHDLPGVILVPERPHTPMMHMLLQRDANALQAAALRLAREERIWTFDQFVATDVPGIRRAELEVGDATLEWAPAEVRRVIDFLLTA